jgi:predicted Zn-dependent protease with MMP-like domain
LTPSNNKAYNGAQWVYDMDAESFETLVLEALDALPLEFARYLDNLEIQIERRPTGDHRRSVALAPGHTLYGLYQGVPLTERVGGDPMLPDLITIFQEPL